MNAKTEEELNETSGDLLGYMNTPDQEAEPLSLAVKKAQSMIHEFYAEGITLGEIADRLNLTQEYLGTQFHKELEKISALTSAITGWLRRKNC